MRSFLANVPVLPPIFGFVSQKHMFLPTPATRRCSRGAPCPESFRGELAWCSVAMPPTIPLSEYDFQEKVGAHPNSNPPTLCRWQPAPGIRFVLLVLWRGSKIASRF